MISKEVPPLPLRGAEMLWEVVDDGMENQPFRKWWDDDEIRGLSAPVKCKDIWSYPNRRLQEPRCRVGESSDRIVDVSVVMIWVGC